MPLLVHLQRSLTVLEDADQDPTLSDTSFIDDSDRESEGSIEKDIECAIDKLARVRNPILERPRRVIDEEPPVPAPDPASEALDKGFIKLGLSSSKKSKKKSRASNARTVFADE